MGPHSPHQVKTVSMQDAQPDIIVAHTKANQVFPTLGLAPYKICFALPPLPTPIPAQCTPTSLALFPSGHSKE
jgi:hypothetical protein